MKHICPDNLLDFAFVNFDTLQYPVRGIFFYLHGYTDATMFTQSNEMAALFGKQGIAWVFPYYSVWAWMSHSSQIFNEQVLDAVYERLGVDDSVPLMIGGGSMGGLTALNYLVYGKREVIGCALNCPVTDMNQVYEDYFDFRRAILSAHIEEQEDLDAVMARYSPVRFVNQLPKIPYFLLFGQNDTYFTDVQRPPFLRECDQNGLSYELLIQPQMGHCDMSNSPDAYQRFCDFLISLPDKQ